MVKSIRVYGCLLCLVAVWLAGCATPEVPFAAKPNPGAAPVYCFDTVGHKPGSKPFIMGGTCSCTPTQALMDKYHADGLLMDMQLKDLLALYEQKGIHTALDHQGCNNLCQWGPHVVKGGHCMVPPTPATCNFEEVRFGIKYVEAETGKKK
jgi:hypothetical protein